jgi:hypothetical protein
MILYHVTDGVAMVGDGGSLAGSILTDGLRLAAKATTMTCYGCRSGRAFG